jgi:hypothetical protein
VREGTNKLTLAEPNLARDIADEWNLVAFGEEIERRINPSIMFLWLRYALHQCALQKSESLGRAIRGAQLLSQLEGRGTPEGFETDMGVRNFIRRHAQKTSRAAGFEMNADDRRMLLRIGREGLPVRSRHDCSRKSTIARRLRRIVDAQFVFAKIDHQLDRSVRHDGLVRMRRSVR